MKTISVIASKCTGVTETLRVYGERECDATFRESDKDAAFELGNSLRKDGIAVTVRPNFNDEGERSFREYRSFNGEPFKEIVFKL